MTSDALSLLHDGEALLDLTDSPHVEVDGVAHRGLTDPTATASDTPDGGNVTVVTGRVGETTLVATLTIARARTAAGRVVRVGLELRNDGSAPVTVTAADAVAARVTGGTWSGQAMSSSWGKEFEPVTLDLSTTVEVESRSGRSSNGWHPWLALVRGEGGALVVSPAWSGNWRIRIDPTGETDGGAGLVAGISPWRFSSVLAPGATFLVPSVVLATGADVEDASVALSGAARAWVARSGASDAVPVEWNHWWPYEDAEINADVFLANAKAAHDMGFEASLLDAGWYGDKDPASDWVQLRGDWDRENTARFPNGISGLADAVRAAGVQFGIWCEAEAVGPGARVRLERPELMARRDDDPPAAPTDPDDPGFLGYICLGSPESQAHFGSVFDSLVERTGCTWIKLDFNLDPGAGCSRTDHGHGAGDGLYAHYMGLYKVLDDFRSRHPQVIVEGCSSGGLRIDLGLAEHLHCFFLSDPDWPEHHFQVAWGASLMLPPVAMLHWTSSEWRTQHPSQHFDVTDPSLRPEDFDAVVRASMLHRFGMSVRLVELPEHLAARLRQHVAVYQETVRPFVVDGVLRRLTSMPRRDGLGERAPAFQLTLDDKDRHLVLAFRLDGPGDPVAARPRSLEQGAQYRVSLPGEDQDPDVRSGSSLLSEGLSLSAGSDATSSLWLLERVQDGRDA